jgi:hypothetical protein
MNPRRKAAEDFVFDLMNRQDPSGYNTNYYRKMFEGMDDETFTKWMTQMRDNPHAKLILYTIPLKVEIDVQASLNTAKFLGIEVFERLRIWDPVEQRHVLTPERYIILRMYVRRLKQYLMDGLSVPDSDRRLNPLTNQVVGVDKASAFSYPQAQMIAEKGLNKTLHEIMTIRGGNIEAYAKMKGQIEENGEASTDVIDDTSGVQSAQTLRTFLEGMHLVTNL